MAGQPRQLRQQRQVSDRIENKESENETFRSKKEIKVNEVLLKSKVLNYLKSFGENDKTRLSTGMKLNFNLTFEMSFPRVIIKWVVDVINFFYSTALSYFKNKCGNLIDQINP